MARAVTDDRVVVIEMRKAIVGRGKMVEARAVGPPLFYRAVTVAQVVGQRCDKALYRTVAGGGPKSETPVAIIRYEYRVALRRSARRYEGVGQGGNSLRERRA